MMPQVRHREALRAGTLRAISALLGISMLCSCGLQRVEGYRRAFDPPDRKVLVVIAAERSVSTYGATSAAEGAGLLAAAAAGSIIFIPLIPWALYVGAKDGADTGKFLDANPDWQRKLAEWMAQRKLEESFRSELQSQFTLEPHAHPTSFSSSEAARDYFAKDKPRNLTVVVITKVNITMDRAKKPGCTDCVTFSFSADLELVDGESGEVLLYDSHSGNRDSNALPLTDYLTDDFAKLDAAMTSAMKSAAWVATYNFKARCGRNVVNCGG